MTEEFATRCEKNINSAYTCWYHYDVSRNVITSGKHELRDRQLDGCDHSDVSRTYLPKCGRLKIKRVLNNNAVISSNSQNGDVLLGSGIAFQKKAGQEVDPQRVEKTFLLKDKEAQNRFTELMIDVRWRISWSVRRSSITPRSNWGVRSSFHSRMQRRWKWRGSSSGSSLS